MAQVRKRRYDRILDGGSPSRDEMAVDYAVAPFGRRVEESDRTWGVDALVTLVSPELAAKYGRALSDLNAAIDAGDAERVADRGANCIRGMDAMDKEARALGHAPPSSGVIVHDLDGWRFGVLVDPALWRIAEEEHPGLRIYTIRELGILARAAEDRHPLLASVKDGFPGATVTDIRKRRGPVPDDEIPF